MLTMNTNKKYNLYNTRSKFNIKKICSKITFFWVIPYLSENILYTKNVISELTGKHLEDFNREIQDTGEELLINKPNKSNSVLYKLVFTKKSLILKVLIFKFGHILSSSMFSIFLSKFMKSNNSSGSISMGFKVILLYIFRLVFESQNRFNSGKLSLEIESLLIKLAYSKLIFNNDNKENGSKSSNIMNIILADCSSFSNLIVSILDLFVFPTKFFMTWFLLKEHVGSAATSAVVTFLIIFILGFLFQIIGSTLKAPFMKYRDLRISKTHEFLRQITSLKLLEQEYILRNQIFEVRKKEAFYNRIRLILVQIGTFLDYHVQAISQLILFISYISKIIEISNNQKTSLKNLGPTGVTILNIFSSVSSIRGLPSQLIEGFISMKRLQTFFAIKYNFNPEDNNSDNRINYTASENLIVEIHAVNNDIQNSEYLNNKDHFLTLPLFEKSVNSKKNNFENLNLKIKNGEKVFFIGESGSGKTALIQFLLSKKHFFRKHVYHLKYDLPIGYVSQVSWIPSGTIRSIILFGSVFKENIYRKVIECCNLLTDFQQWKDGDLKIVDEGGNALSKGQRTRICIARTLYCFFSMDNVQEFPLLFIFDDIFFNLDQFVANKIFYNLFNSNGLLANSTVITTIDNKSLSSFLKYSSNLDSNSPVNYYHSFQYFYIDNFNLLFNQYTVPYQVIINNMESIITDTHIDLLSRDHSMIFSPIQRNYEKNDTNDKDRFQISNHKLESELCNSNNGDKTNINFLTEVVNTKGCVSINIYKWYLLNIGKYNILSIFFLVLLKSIVERSSELLFTAQSSQIDTLKRFLFLYTLFSSIGLIFGIYLFLFEAIACTIGSNEIHKKLFNILLSKVSQIIPIHSSLNRFAGDMLIVDTCILKSIISTIFPILTIFGQSLFILYTFPYFIPFFLLWIVIFIYPICAKFILAYREYQRFSLSLFSSICGIFSGSQLGVATISMLKKQHLLINQAHESIDLFIKVKFIQLTATQWAGFWMNMAMTPIGILLNVIILKITPLVENTMISTILNFSTQSGSAIICIYYFLSIAESISTFMYKFVQMEKEMCSIERILHFIESFLILEDQNPKIEGILYCKEISHSAFEGLKIENLQVSTLRYIDSNNYTNDFFQKLEYDQLLTVDGNIAASPGNIVGIVGRTGSGKSSLINSIMGLYTRIDGTILLNNINTNLITRKNEIIGFLPQECFLIKGTTIRNLLDPFSEHSESFILHRLRKYKLLDFVKILPLQLETFIVYEENFNSNYTELTDSVILSTSQIRYLSFVRLLMTPKKYQLLLIDEPPYKVTFSFNNIMFDTISIHSIIRSEFKHCPSLIITHNTDVFEFCDIFWILKNKKLKKVIFKQIDNYSKSIWNELE